MALQQVEVTKVPWRQLMPWLLLFRTFSISLRVRHLVLGMLIAVLMAVGVWLIEQPNDVNWPWEAITTQELSDDLFPSEHFLQPALDPFRLWSKIYLNSWTWNGFGTMLLSTTWRFVIGGLAGGLLCRFAAYELLREESISWKRGLRSIKRHCQDYLFCAGLPWGAMVCLLLMGVAWAFLIRPLVPESTFGQVLYGFRLLFSFPAALLVIGLAVGWSLMIASLSVSQTDGFDAFSRGYGMVYDRWRYLAWCVFVWWLYGQVLYYIVLGFCGLVLAGANWFDLSSRIISHEPMSMFHFISILDFERNGQTPLLWRQFFQLLIVGWMYSYFWTGAVAIFVILRKSIDGNELDELSGDPPDTLPTLEQLLQKPSGTPASSSDPGPSGPLLPVITQP